MLYAVERVLSKLHNSVTGDGEQGVLLRAHRRSSGWTACTALLFDSCCLRVARPGLCQRRAGRRRVRWPATTCRCGPWLTTQRVDVSRVVDGLLASRLLQAGGLLTSLDDIGQQWDCPNAWPPLQHMVFEGSGQRSLHTGQRLSAGRRCSRLSASLACTAACALQPAAAAASSSTQYAASLAYYLSSSWLYGNAALFNDSSPHVREVLRAAAEAQQGQEASIEVQEGFGWSNGVALILLQQYGRHTQLHTAGQRCSRRLRSVGIIPALPTRCRPCTAGCKRAMQLSCCQQIQ